MSVTFTVYWGEATPDQVCAETGEGIIPIKNRQAQEVIGFERLYYRPETEREMVTVETLRGTV